MSWKVEEIGMEALGKKEKSMEKKFYCGPCVWLGVFLLALPLGLWLSGWEPTVEAQEPAIQRGKASYYTTVECRTRDNPRCLTASREPLNDGAMTCASWFYPFGTRLRVTHVNRSVVVRVNDRGPNERLVKQGRVIDLTRAAFSRLAPTERGVIPVTVEVLR